jgi:tetratricopeptide (TPR) repeat protein
MRNQRNRFITLGVSLLLAGSAVLAQKTKETTDKGSAEGQLAVLIEGLGKYHRPITTHSALAQRYFDQGLLFVYGYYFPQALASFQEAARLDPQCAMIQWGMALAIGPDPNSRYTGFPDDPKGEGRAAIQKAWSLRAGASEKERAFIAALLVRYDREKYPDRSQRDAAYAQAMKELLQRYPDDPEAGTLYADALMTMSPWNYWMPDGQPRPGTSEVVSALEHVMAIHPDHPLANHLYVHLFENSQNPARALPAADRLAQTMPGEGHIIHMPSHIYIRVGQYAKAIANNERSLAADKEVLRLWGNREMPTGDTTYPLSARIHNMHANEFIRSAATLEGNYAMAIEAGRASAAEAAAATMDMASNFVSERRLMQPWFTYRRFGKWQEILAEPAPSKGVPFVEGVWHFVRGSAFVATGKLQEATSELERVKAAASDPAIAKLPTGINLAGAILTLSAETLSGEIAAARGEIDSALLHFETAIRMEDGVPYTEPPFWDDPVRLSLGKVLLKAKRPSEAEVVYWEDLRRHPENGWALYGLMQAFQAQGRAAEAMETEKRFQKAWTNADVKLDTL